MQDLACPGRGKRRKLCKHWATGRCNYAERCQFEHALPAPAKPPTQPPGDDAPPAASGPLSSTKIPKTSPGPEWQARPRESEPLQWRDVCSGATFKVLDGLAWKPPGLPLGCAGSAAADPLCPHPCPWGRSTDPLPGSAAPHGPDGGGAGPP
eukprot:EG_transcript_24309